MSTYFFCGIGGSGMLPLAVLLKARGHDVAGSDRARDQGKTPEKFKALEDFGIDLFPQDASGVLRNIDYLVVSSAVEPSIPDVKAAIERGIPIIKRGALLAQCFNQALTRIGVAGTSGKSTVTGMIGTMLMEMGADPTIVNGGEIRNLETQFSGIRNGREDLFVAEMDESDGSIADYNPTLAVLNNIAIDHKSMEELEQLFGDYLLRAENAVIVNGDHPRVMEVVKRVKPQAHIITYGMHNSTAIQAFDITPRADGVTFQVKSPSGVYPVNLRVPGHHNVMNALAALAVAEALNLDFAQACKGLEAFRGIHRRLELIGTKNNITVIDDFAHNPDKIAASLSALKAFDGRLIVMFQPHGFAPLKLMGAEIVQAFAQALSADDILIMPEVYYAGGTVERSVTAADIIGSIKAQGLNAHWFAHRADILPFITKTAQAGDRIVIMGARDDTLHDFARGVLANV